MYAKFSNAKLLSCYGGVNFCIGLYCSLVGHLRLLPWSGDYDDPKRTNQRSETEQEDSSDQKTCHQGGDYGGKKFDSILLRVS